MVALMALIGLFCGDRIRALARSYDDLPAPAPAPALSWAPSW